MIASAFKALNQMFTPPLRRVLFKAVGLALLLIAIIGVGLQRLFAAMANSGATWAEQSTGVTWGWEALTWILSIMASLGIITGALFLMPAVTAFVGSFFVDEIADVVEREHYPAEPRGPRAAGVPRPDRRHQDRPAGAVRLSGRAAVPDLCRLRPGDPVRGHGLSARPRIFRTGGDALPAARKKPRRCARRTPAIFSSPAW